MYFVQVAHGRWLPYELPYALFWLADKKKIGPGTLGMTVAVERWPFAKNGRRIKINVSLVTIHRTCSLFSPSIPLPDDHSPFAFSLAPADADSRIAFSCSVGVDSRARLDSLPGLFLSWPKA